MKKIIALLCSVLVLFGALSVSAAAMPYSEGLGALKTQFVQGVGPETDDLTIDYLYFSPVKENDTVEYPLVVWLHGMWDGSYIGRQVKNNGIGYWTSDEFQSRFPAGGAFIMAPRSPEEQFIYWEDRTVYPLRAAIDDFIAQNKDNIDLSRIYIGGYSMGGRMTLKMITAYPDMFAAAFPICPAWSPDEASLELIKDMPIWLTCGENDTTVNFKGVAKTWNNICGASERNDINRFSTMTVSSMPDGSPAPSGHESWQAVAHDMFSFECGDYPNMSTVDGNGNEVKLTYPDGMISWLSQFTSDFDGSAATDSGNIKPNWSGICIDTFIRSLFGRMFVTLIKVIDRITDKF